MEFYERLKKIREDSNISSKEMAKKIGVAPSTYSQYENGKREPDVFKIKEISKALNISADYLLFGKTPTTLVNLTKHEEKILNAYRAHPEMRDAVDKLLGVEPTDTETRESLSA